MNLNEQNDLYRTLRFLNTQGLLSHDEVAVVEGHCLPASPFAVQLEKAETVHLHIKVDDTAALPQSLFFDNDASPDHSKDGFVKYRFPGGVNVIFSHIAVSQDDLLERPATRRRRPFLDHIGIDIRDESEDAYSVFSAVPDIAADLGEAVVRQGGGDRSVACCHVEVAEKCWVFPQQEPGDPGVPLEFAWGQLKMNSTAGCDLRPSHPDSAENGQQSCCSPDIIQLGECCPDN